MDFNPDKPIFRQIVDLCHGRILSGEWLPGQKIASVREMAITLAVNARTVLSAFECLQDEGVIVMRRGLGFFLCDDADVRVKQAMRRDFFTNTLPQIFTDMRSLGISISDIAEHWNENS